MYNRMKLLAGKTIYDRTFKLYFHPLTLDFIAKEFEQEKNFLNAMNILGMDEDDLKYQADKIMDDTKRSDSPIEDLVLTKYQILMIYIISGIKQNNPESFLSLIDGFLKIFKGTCYYKN